MLLLINTFDGGLKRSSRLFMVPVSSFSTANNKEGGNETKMKSPKGGEEMRLLSLSTCIKREQRGGKEKVWGMV